MLPVRLQRFVITFYGVHITEFTLLRNFLIESKAVLFQRAPSLTLLAVHVSFDLYNQFGETLMIFAPSKVDVSSDTTPRPAISFMESAMPAQPDNVSEITKSVNNRLYLFMRFLHLCFFSYNAKVNLPLKQSAAAL